MDELGGLDRGWVDATQGHVLALEGGRFRLNVGANVASFRTKEEVKDGLDTIGL
jgi:hypothetical protein